MSDLEERVIKTEEVYQGKLVTLRRDIVEIAPGKRALREVVVHPGAVAVVPFLDRETIILVRQYRHAIGQELLEIPAGTLKKGETAEECAQRELKEEIGYEAGNIRKITRLFPAPGYTSEAIDLFIASDLHPSKGQAEEDEVVEPVALKLESAIDWVRNGVIKDGKTIIGILIAWDRFQQAKGG